MVTLAIIRNTVIPSKYGHVRDPKVQNASAINGIIGGRIKIMSIKNNGMLISSLPDLLSLPYLRMTESKGERVSFSANVNKSQA